MENIYCKFCNEYGLCEITSIGNESKCENCERISNVEQCIEYAPSFNNVIAICDNAVAYTTTNKEDCLALFRNGILQGALPLRILSESIQQKVYDIKDSVS